MKKFTAFLIGTLMMSLSLFGLSGCSSKHVKVTISLSNDKEINLILYKNYAPETVENFVKNAKEGFYNNMCVSEIGTSSVVFGDYYYDENAKTYTKAEAKPTIKGEFSDNGVLSTDGSVLIPHELGVISMWRDTSAGKNSASVKFCLMSATDTSRDGYYCAFGKCADDTSKKVITELSALDVDENEDMDSSYAPLTAIYITGIKIK